MKTYRYVRFATNASPILIEATVGTKREETISRTFKIYLNE